MNLTEIFDEQALEPNEKMRTLRSKTEALQQEREMTVNKIIKFATRAQNLHTSKFHLNEPKMYVGDPRKFEPILGIGFIDMSFEHAETMVKLSRKIKKLDARQKKLKAAFADSINYRAREVKGELDVT